MIKLSLKSNRLLVIVIFSGCFLTHQGTLDRMWPVKYGLGTPQQLTAVAEGFILKKDNDTVKGYIRMVIHYYSGETIENVPLLPFHKKEKADIIEVKLGDIDFVRVKWYAHKKTFDFMPIRSTMWLIVGRKDQVRVCSQSWDKYTDEISYANTDELALVEGNDIIAIPIAGANILNPRTLYIRHFIHKRYGQHFTRNELKTEKELIDYILDQESKRLSTTDIFQSPALTQNDLDGFYENQWANGE